MRYSAAFASLLMLAACTESAAGPADTLAPSFANGLTPRQFDSGEIPVDIRASCGSFDFTAIGTTRERNTGFFDANGELLVVQGHIRATVVWTNLSTGKSFTERQAFNFKADFRSGFIETDTGKFFNVKDGIHVMDVGKFVIDWETGEVVFQSGQHDIGLGSSRPATCALLS
jgi:hypothetical protein